MNNKKCLKKVAGILSASLMLSGIMGVVSTVSGNTDTAVIAEAAPKKTEAQLRKIVLGQVPGTVMHHYQEWDDGIIEHHYVIKTSSGAIVEVEILANGYITDIDYEDDYYGDDYYDDDYYDWD